MSGGIQGSRWHPTWISVPIGEVRHVIVCSAVCDILMQRSQHQTYNIPTILDDYYALVQNYSNRELTVDSDKLPGLLRNRPGSPPRTRWRLSRRALELATSPRGLSWEARITHSQARTPVPSPFVVVGDDKRERLFAHSKQSPFDVRLLHHNITPTDTTNPYGEIRSGSLTLQGRTKSSCAAPKEIHAWPCSFSIGSMVFDNTSINEAIVDAGRNGIWRFYDLFRVIEEDGDYILSIINQQGRDQDWDIDFDCYRPESYLVLLLNVDIGPDGDTSPSACLVLQQVENDEFKRGWPP